MDIKDNTYSIARSLIPETFMASLVKYLAKELKEYIEKNKLTDEFLELLLNGMGWAFYLSKKYRTDNLNFEGYYLFKTSDRDDKVEASVVFKKGKMTVYNKAYDRHVPSVTVIFENSKALCDYIFSKDQDILNSLLKNEVQVTGNLNYIYKFGYMARELTDMIGIKNGN